MTARHWAVVVLTFLLLAGATAERLTAQQAKATITGIITDPTGAAIAGASVTVTNTLTNAAFVTQSNESGFYTAPGLSVGEYSVAVSQPAFKKAVHSGIVLQVNQTAQVNFALEIGQVTESVEIVGTAPLVEGGSATLGKVIENRRLQELPINGRNALALILLVPGVKSNAGPINTGFGERGMEISHRSINGGPNGMNASILDGATNVHSGGAGEVNISPPVDSIEEFKVQSGNMSAEFGFTAGGVINLVTKSGTNRFHGAAYEFLRNDALDARRAFSATKQSFRYNQFGAAAGGPIRRDKTFFFGLWEEYRFRRGLPYIATTPTALQHEGNFSDLLDRNGRLIPIYDPFSTRANPAGSGYLRDPMPNNTIPTSRLDPVALNVQKFYPLPNYPPSDPFTNSNNFFHMQNIQKLMRTYSAKVDHRFTDRNSFFGRFAYYQHQTDSANDDPGPWPDPLLTKRDDMARNFNVILNDTQTFSPTLINEFRVGINGQRFHYLPRGYMKGIPQQLGLPASHPPDLPPNISNGLRQGFTQQWGYRISHVWSAQNLLTKIAGNHTIKVGVEYRLNLAFEDQRNPASGAFTFAAGLTGDPQNPAQSGYGYATFLFGAVSQASLSTFLGSTMRGHSVSGFIQEDWKVNRRLTLNLGLRYDFQQNPYEINSGVSNFDPFSPDPVSGLMGRLVFGATEGHGGNFMRDDYNDFGPRFGFAYDVTGQGRTVIRGGYGFYFPYTFHRWTFPGRDGFFVTTTTYNPPGNNTNFAAFRFRDGLPYPATPPRGKNLGPNGLLGQSVGFMQADERTSYSQQFSLGIQQQLSRTWLVEASYSSNFGHHFGAGSYDYNQLDPQYLRLGRTLQDRVPNPYAGRVPGALGDPTITRLQSLRPYPYYNTISVREPRLGNFSYNSLILSAEKRMSQGLAMLFSYTWGKVLADSIRSPVDFGGNEQTTVIGYQDGKFNRAVERSLDPTDVAHRGVLSVLYEFPFGRGKRWASSQPVVEKLVSGWQTNLIATLQTGIPLVVRGASNFLADRPNSTGKSAQLPRSARSSDRWFDTDQFVNPPEYTYGNVGRVLPDVRTPGTSDWDLSLIKNTRLTERFSLQFRAEAFNFLNHTILRGPGVSFVPGPDGRNRSGTFGVITDARDARIIQFGLKLIF